MAVHQKLRVFVTLHIYFHDLILAQPDLLFSDCGLNGNYTQNSAYHNNLNTLLSSLSSNMNNYGFYNASIGRNADLVSVIVLCRGDVELQECRTCVNNAAQKIVRSCPVQKEAFGGYDECMLQYSGRPIIGTTTNDPLLYMWDSGNASKPQEFNRELKKLVETLRGQAVNGDPFRKYASGSATDPNDQTIYALVQCTPDLSPQDCSDCLTNAYGAMATCPCNGNRGSRQIGPRCNFRYQSYRFFKHVASESPPQGKDDKSARTVIIIVVSTVITIILMVCTLIILMKMRKRKMQDKIQSRRVDDISTAESLQYDLSTIREATDNFSSSNKLGSGGFGPVYKGVLQNGQEVAVKRLSANSSQGDQEFKNEILLVARLQHRNLVRLLGFCLDGIERLLVYEFVPNASLDQFLFDPVKRRQLNWERRSKIIGGVARGILYLHEDSRLRIIHRDLKASNVLLDAEMNPKISDFGMARLFALDETQGNTSRVVGTYGYMAPEYATRGKFSVKSDVFSFGVLLLEIISGQKNMCSRNEESMEDLLSYAWSNWQQGTPTNLIDPLLRESTGVLVPDIMRDIHIGLLCIQDDIADRPTMAAVVLMLSSASVSLPVPSGPPAYYTHDDITSPEISRIHEAQNQVN
ncbi:Cysteine-rich receptor-like protein kinase 10 [Capsicum chinense]|nr:Cysteine-rich receptor-like protein kinase 10 [Capsicum chinense]